MLDVRIASSEVSFGLFVQVTDLRTRERFLHKPFPRAALDHVLALDVDRIACLGEDRTLLIMDGRTGENLQSRRLSADFAAGRRLVDVIRCPAHGAIALVS